MGRVSCQEMQLINVFLSGMFNWHDCPVNAVDVSPDSSVVASGGEDGTCKVSTAIGLCTAYRRIWLHGYMQQLFFVVISRS